MVKPAPIMADSNNFRGYEAEDIIKCGYMMIKRPPTSGKVRIKVESFNYFQPNVYVMICWHFSTDFATSRIYDLPIFLLHSISVIIQYVC